MTRLRYMMISGLIFMSLIIVSASAALEGNDKSSLSDIPKIWTDIDPDEIYPDFQYLSLTPACAACPGCNEKFTFFVKGGTVNKVVVYFQGGGACWESMNCLYLHTYYEEVPPIDMFDDTEGMGIFDTDNPENPFKDWYFVYIPYCTGDVHWGANDMEYEDYLDLIPFVDSWTIQHRGFVNFKVVLQWMEDNFTRPRKIFVTGSSAGAYGAILGFPHLKEAFPRSRVYILGDAGNGVTSDSFQTQYIYNWNIQLPDWIPGFQGGYSPEMTIDYVYKTIAAYYPLSKLAQFTTGWDWNQAFFYNVMVNIHNPLKWDDYEEVWCEWHDQMIEYAYTTAEATNYRYYIAAGDYHTIMMSPEFYTEDSAGVPFTRWVKAMVRNPFGMWGGPLEGRWKNLECDDCQDPLSCP